MSAVEPKDVYKEEEFKEFVKLLDEGGAAHWIDIAKALDVSPNTITAWKKRPEARAAIRKGIVRALKNMEDSGSKDWRMWQEKLKMLGLNPAIKIDAIIDDPRKEILKKYLGGEDAGKTEETES